MKKDVNTFNNSNIIINEKFTYFKDKNHKSKKIIKNKYTTSTALKSIDTKVIVAKTSICITLCLTGIGLIVIPISKEPACSLSIGKKVKYEIVMQNQKKKYKEQHEKDKKTTKSFDKMSGESLQDNLIDENEFESLYIFVTRYVDGKKWIFFNKHEHKNRISFF